MGLLKRIQRLWRQFSYTVKHPIKKPKVRVNRVNRLMLGMVNKERRKRNLNPVLFDKQLEQHSRRWSKRMAHEGYLSHSGTILENCCMVPRSGSPGTITKRMFHTWKKSRPHWGWMMNPTIRKAAFAYNSRGKYSYGAYSFK